MPEILSGWFTDRMTGRAEAGGQVTWIFDRFGARFPYDVLVAEPPARLLLKGNPVGRPPYHLEILIGAGEGGGTTIEIVNSGFMTGSRGTGSDGAGSREAGADDEFEGVVSGWQMALAILTRYLERHHGQPRESFFAMQPARFDYEAIRPYFQDPKLLSRWLTRSGGIGATGTSIRLELFDGSTLSGEVLAVTSREAAISWSEINGILELKAFQLSPLQRAVCLRGSGWGLSGDEAARVEKSMPLIASSKP